MEPTFFDWAIIGAGPAGIAAVGKLLDFGIDPQKIAWIDPAFTVGDFGTKWKNVSSNTKVEHFIKYFQACRSFQYAAAPPLAIHKKAPNDTCLLAQAAEPLQWISNHLQKKVLAFIGEVQRLKLENRQWHLTLSDFHLHAKNVVIAIGSEPKSLALSGIVELPLATALDPRQLTNLCEPKDVIAVFGSSHSAICVLQNLLEINIVQKVINFYLSPLRYAVYFEDWILFDDTGLKGNAATWARDNIDGQLPKKLERLLSTPEDLHLHLPLCTKAIYATGFQKRFLAVEGLRALEYNDKSGIIAPGLFGLGIAFPEAKIDKYGTLEYRVGLWKFMEYLNHVMPVWLKYTA